MSGLTLAEMRRLGAQRNADAAPKAEAAGKGSPLRSLLTRATSPGSGADNRASVAAVATPSPRSGIFGFKSKTETSPAKPQTAADDIGREQGALVDWAGKAITERDIHQVFSGITRSHLIAGAGLGALLGFGAASSPLGAPVGLMAGAAGGYVVGSRVARTSSADDKAVLIKEREAPQLFEAIRNAASLARHTPEIVSVSVMASPDCHVEDRRTKRGAARMALKIGYPLLLALSIEQLEVLLAHRFAVFQEHRSDALRAAGLNRLDAATSRLNARSSLLRLSKTDDMAGLYAKALGQWRQAIFEVVVRADVATARYAGKSRLAQALLAQGLVAAHLAILSKGVDHRASETANPIASLRNPLQQSELDAALKALADHATPDPVRVASGVPCGLVDRIFALDTTVERPRLPARHVALAELTAKAQARLSKAYEAPARIKKAGRKAAKPTTIVAREAADRDDEPKGRKQSLFRKKPVGASESENRAPEKEQRSKPSKTGRQSLLARFFPGRGGKASAAFTADDLTAQPLYQADSLFASDAATGTEAYAALVAAHPRWALARLRLGEAQIASGIPDGITNLMASAETLPSALPSILDAIRSALPMVSPLEQEGLHDAINALQENADAIAAERAEIDLDGLQEHAFDASDIETLKELFAHTPGLREVWAFRAPVMHMPEVPHHAILALATSMHPDDAQATALMIAEHAAVLGTVAVHVETGRPSGALGDRLASMPSLWRAN